MNPVKKIFLGNRRLQGLYKFLFKVAIKGMNYDRGHIPSFSGEKYLLKKLSQYYKNKKIIVFDAGANTGEYTKMVLAAFNDRAQVYAFEPSAIAFESLKKMENSNISFFQIGLGKEEQQQATLYSNKAGSVWGSVYPASYSNYGVRLDQQETIELISVDAFCKKNTIKEIHLLKADTEGYELEILKGAKEMLSTGNIHFIQFEFGLASISARVFLKDFFEILPGYKIYRILQNGFYEIQYSEQAELFLTTNYLAIRREEAGEFLKRK